MDAKVILGYWDLRGIAEPIRYMLHYLGVDFEDRRYDMRTEMLAPESRDWIKDREEYGFLLPNLPYLIDGQTRITQRTVIMRYLARKHGLCFPEDLSKDALLLEMLEVMAKDFMDFTRLVAFNENFEKMRPFMGQKFDGLVSQVSKHLGEKKWLLGDNISHVDFLMFDSLDVLTALCPNMVEKYQNLEDFKQRFKELPGVKEYRRGSTKWPILPGYAKWGSGVEPPKCIL